MPSNRRGQNFSSEMSDHDAPPGKSWCDACDTYYVNRHERDAQRHFSSKQHEKNAHIQQLDERFSNLLRESPVVTDQYQIRPCIRNIHNCVYFDINDDDILGEAAVRRVITELRMSQEPDGSVSTTPPAAEDAAESRVFNPSERSRLKEFFEALRETLKNVKVGEIGMLVQQMMMVFAMQVVDTGETLDYVPDILPELCEEQLKIVPQGMELARHFLKERCQRLKQSRLGCVPPPDEPSEQQEQQEAEPLPLPLPPPPQSEEARGTEAAAEGSEAGGPPVMQSEL